MTNHFEYKGYLGSAEVDIEGDALVGKLLFIRDLITYSATTTAQLEKAFREAVDEYLATCAELGDAPDEPCKGSFNVRIGPVLHRQVALAARCKGVGLNEFVCRALTVATQDPSRQTIEHLHKHEHCVLVQAPWRSAPLLTSSQPVSWEGEYGTHH